MICKQGRGNMLTSTPTSPDTSDLSLVLCLSYVFSKLLRVVSDNYLCRLGNQMLIRLFSPICPCLRIFQIRDQFPRCHQDMQTQLRILDCLPANERPVWSRAREMHPSVFPPISSSATEAGLRLALMKHNILIFYQPCSLFT